jgi:hypothetical protein
LLSSETAINLKLNLEAILKDFRQNRRESKFGGDLINLILLRIGALSETPSKTRRNLG